MVGAGEKKKLTPAEMRKIQMELQEERGIAVVDNWNEMVGHLQKAKEVWDQKVKGITADEIALIPDGKIKALSVYRVSTFEVMLGKFIDFWRASGGLDTMIIDSPGVQSIREKVLRKQFNLDKAKKES